MTTMNTNPYIQGTVLKIDYNRFYILGATEDTVTYMKRNKFYEGSLEPISMPVSTFTNMLHAGFLRIVDGNIMNIEIEFLPFINYGYKGYIRFRDGSFLKPLFVNSHQFKGIFYDKDGKTILNDYSDQIIDILDANKICYEHMISGRRFEPMLEYVETNEIRDYYVKDISYMKDKVFEFLDDIRVQIIDTLSYKVKFIISTLEDGEWKIIEAPQYYVDYYVLEGYMASKFTNL